MKTNDYVGRLSDNTALVHAVISASWCFVHPIRVLVTD